MASPVIAIIDIGSNSIKALVARRGDDGIIESLGMKTLDARISAGISRAEPRLSDEGMQRGLDAVQELLAFVAPHHPRQTVLVATSAVRDAANGEVFRARVMAATGLEIRILSGHEEANLIGRGLAADPALGPLRDFYVFDLGGGSLECLAFQDRRMIQALSLPLGCVRLTERFVDDPTAPVPDQALQAITRHTQDELGRSGFRFDLAAAPAVFAGGTMTTARLIFGMREGRSLAETSAALPLNRLRALLTETAALPLAERRMIPGLPPARADVFPTALATALAVASLAGVDGFRHSLYNLRWGLAATLL